MQYGIQKLYSFLFFKTLSIYSVHIFGETFVSCDVEVGLAKMRAIPEPTRG